jgi:hypothetical protein
MECLINGTKIKYEDGKVWKFGKASWNSREETWFVLKGTILPTGRIQIQINYKTYYKHRLIYKCHHPDWDIEDSGPNNTIDHININCTDNSLDNLRVATMLQQNLNKDYVIQAKGYYWRECRQKWYVKISINNKQINLGWFELEADARQAYLDAVQKYR